MRVEVSPHNRPGLCVAFPLSRRLVRSVTTEAIHASKTRTGLFDSVFEHCLCSFLLIARRPRGTLLRDIVLFGLYLRLGQLLVLDGTVMLHLMRLDPGAVTFRLSASG
jgi:hypothetical protein